MDKADQQSKMKTNKQRKGEDSILRGLEIIVYVILSSPITAMLKFTSENKSNCQRCLDCSPKCEQSIRDSGTSHSEGGSFQSLLFV